MPKPQRPRPRVSKIGRHPNKHLRIFFTNEGGVFDKFRRSKGEELADDSFRSSSLPPGISMKKYSRRVARAMIYPGSSGFPSHEEVMHARQIHRHLRTGVPLRGYSALAVLEEIISNASVAGNETAPRSVESFTHIRAGIPRMLQSSGWVGRFFREFIGLLAPHLIMPSSVNRSPYRAFILMMRNKAFREHLVALNKVGVYTVTSLSEISAGDRATIEHALLALVDATESLVKKRVK